MGDKIARQSRDGAATAFAALAIAVAWLAAVPAEAGATAGGGCDAGAAGFALNRELTNDVAEQARKAAGAVAVQHVYVEQAPIPHPPAGHLIFKLDQGSRVIDVACG